MYHYLIGCSEKISIYIYIYSIGSVVFLLKDAKLESNCVKSPDKFKLRHSIKLVSMEHHVGNLLKWVREKKKKVFILYFGTFFRLRLFKN